MEEQAMKIPTAAYCRVSTMSDLQDGSYEVQRDYYKKLIESNPDMELVGIYGDHGKSGRTMQTRPQLKKLIRDCEEGKIKLILTKSISRFARNMMECVETIRHLRELGVKVVFEKEGLDTESMGGELMLGILATIAQEESNSISQNLNWSRRQHALRGEPWERPPYGYVSVGKQHKWEPVEEQGDVVRQAFYMAGMCYKYPDIVEELNRMEREMGSERVWTHGKVDNPVSLYAATKKSNELLAHAYSKLYNIPSTGLRFFTVYGPAGRPDMFYFSATNTLSKGGTIKIFNYGDMRRDFTYIDDIVEGVYRVMQGAPEKKNGEDGLPIPPYAVYNIGGGQPENLLDYISTLQEELVRAKVLPEDYDFEGHRELVGMQAGDVPVTYADSEALEKDYGFTPKIGIREGLRAFAEWYAEYYR